MIIGVHGMSEFTYEIPDQKAFLKALILVMNAEGLGEIARTLEGGECEIVDSQQFSYQRWDGHKTYLILRVPLEKYEYAVKKVTDEIKLKIVSIADKLMPKNTGLDVMEMSLSPSIEATPLKESLISDLDSSKVLSQGLSREVLPDDIKAKGKEMAYTYVYLYCVENALRLFLEKVAKGAHGDNFFSHLQINKDIDTKLRARKVDESKNKWLCIRGDSEIFYLDFDDLGNLIRNNWEIFKTYFPSQEWIVTKIDELSKCRNLVAHNSYIGKEERELIMVYFNTIMRQIGSTVK